MKYYKFEKIKKDENISYYDENGSILGYMNNDFIISENFNENVISDLNGYLYPRKKSNGEPFFLESEIIDGVISEKTKIGLYGYTKPNLSSERILKANVDDTILTDLNFITDNEGNIWLSIYGYIEDFVHLYMIYKSNLNNYVSICLSNMNTTILKNGKVDPLMIEMIKQEEGVKVG